MPEERGRRAAFAGRPAPDYRTGTGTRALRLAAWAVFVAGVLLIAARYPALPATIPTHFDATGTPDGFGPRTSILWLPLLWFVLQAGLLALSRYPRIFNYPVPVTADNAQRLYREGEQLMVVLAAEVAVMFLGIVLMMLDGASTGRLALGAGPVLAGAGLVGVLAACVVGIVRMLR
ncbi:DUF1648 domain-containing protein [Georgenia thermotolerans]|uniref:DUF1648 domain-containing protein n=1 Tax=Georgenia thermotolerans TaxID=527326 RepID=A0A7J5UNY9_9MICO|nr:DUF1648 domain-containing protein [Georgenia thermotolerans]KAE8764089.1 DUF1648 domain-containing protein [Georgenia thermotolerans]